MATLLDELLGVPAAVRDAAISALDEGAADRILHDWFGTWAREEQKPPDWNWRVWLILAGRGYGKTRTGAEMVRGWALSGRYPLVNIIGATADDARDIMVDGESGVLACCTNSERPRYMKSERALHWRNGTKTLIFTADEPERLRGKQHMKLWCDELAAWRYLEAWTQAMLGLRLGDNPQAVVTTTPRPLPLVRELLAREDTAATRGSTYDNRANLAPAFFSQIISRYEGTRLGRQELLAELLEDYEGALWTRERLDALRVRAAPAEGMQRVVVAIDPSGTSDDGADEVGIVVAGRSADGHYYTLDDRSGRLSPDAWARRAVDAYYAWGADRIVAEGNFGGDMVEHTIRTVDKRVAFKKVTASRGKHVRAEPIAALTEQGKAHMVGAFPQLEDQLAAFTANGYEGGGSPDRGDAYVWALTELAERGRPQVL